MSESGLEVVLDARVVRRPSRKVVVPSGCPAIVRRPSQLTGSGRKTLPDDREPLPNDR